MKQGDVTVTVMEPSAPADDERGTRAEVLERAVTAGGTLLVGGVLIAGLPRLAISAPSHRQDLDVLNFALLLESLQAAYYKEAESRGTLVGEWRQFAQVVGREERDHVAYLRRTLGADAKPTPRFRFGSSASSQGAFAASSVALEDLGLAAYNGQATNLTASALRAAARVISVEARHAAWARGLAGKNPAPDAVDAPASQVQVEKVLRARGLIG